jgi:hypothetical protein
MISNWKHPIAELNCKSSLALETRIPGLFIPSLGLFSPTSGKCTVLRKRWGSQPPCLVVSKYSLLVPCRFFFRTCILMYSVQQVSACSRAPLHSNLHMIHDAFWAQTSYNDVGRHHSAVAQSWRFGNAAPERHARDALLVLKQETKSANRNNIFDPPLYAANVVRIDSGLAK